MNLILYLFKLENTLESLFSLLLSHRLSLTFDSDTPRRSFFFEKHSSQASHSCGTKLMSAKGFDSCLNIIHRRGHYR